MISRLKPASDDVSLIVLAADHAGAPQTVLQLAQSYGGDPKVRVFVINNSAELKRPLCLIL